MESNFATKIDFKKKVGIETKFDIKNNIFAHCAVLLISGLL